MNILFLGSRYINSTSMCLGPEMGAQGFKFAGFIDTFVFVKKFLETYRNSTWNKHYVDKIPLPLSFLYKLLPSREGKQITIDYIIVEQNGFHFYNDVDIPVIYYHRDIPTPLFMLDMDILLYRFTEMERVIAKDYPKIWGNGIVKKKWLNGVRPENFAEELPKIYEGINWIGWQKPFSYYWKLPAQAEYYKHAKEICDYAREHFLIQYHEHGIRYPEAKRILQQSEAVLVIPGTKAYVTRKIYEAAMCKTLIVLHVQNDEALEIYTEIGLIHNKNCIMFRKKEELKAIADLEGVDVGGMTDLAHKWVNEKHLWAHRAQELKQICEAYGNISNK